MPEKLQAASCTDTSMEAPPGRSVALQAHADRASSTSAAAIFRFEVIFLPLR